MLTIPLVYIIQIMSILHDVIGTFPFTTSDKNPTKRRNNHPIIKTRDIKRYSELI